MNCKVIKKWQLPISTSTPPLKVYPPFLAKNFVPLPPKWLHFWKVLPKVGGGVPTMMNPNDVMVVVLKDIILCLFGFRFICMVYISWYYIWGFKCVATTNMLVFRSACLSSLPVLSVKLQWMIQVTREIQGNSWIQEFLVCCK